NLFPSSRSARPGTDSASLGGFDRQVSAFGLDGQDWNGSVEQDALSVRPEDELADGRAPAQTDDDELASVRLHGIDEVLGRVMALAVRALQAQPLGLQPGPCGRELAVVVLAWGTRGLDDHEPATPQQALLDG